MSFSFIKFSLFFSCTLLTVSSVFAAGSGAYRLEVPDAAAVGKGSAFAGEANNPSSVYYNPAGMTQLGGSSMSLGMSLIQPKGSYESNDGDIKTKMQRDTHTIPHGYFVTDLGTEKFAFGLGVTSSWGLVTDWSQESFAKYSTTRAEVSNKDYMFTVAYEVNDHWSLAAGIDVDDSLVNKQKKLNLGLGGPDANFKLKGDDVSAGFRVAGLYKLNDRHQFGLMYRSPIEHKYKGKVYIDEGVAAGLGAAFNIPDSYQTDVISKSTLPDSIVLGYSYKPDSKWTFNLDIEWMNWSLVNKEELAYPTETDLSRLALLNTGNPVSRDWISVFSGAFGVQYAVSERLRVRGGYYHHQSPVPNDTWEPNLPDAVSHGLTTGFGYDLSKSLTLDLAWSGIYYMPRDIDNAVNNGDNNGTYKQWTNLMYMTMTYKF